MTPMIYVNKSCALKKKKTSTKSVDDFGVLSDKVLKTIANQLEMCDSDSIDFDFRSFTK